MRVFTRFKTRGMQSPVAAPPFLPAAPSLSLCLSRSFFPAKDVLLPLVHWCLHGCHEASGHSCFWLSCSREPSPAFSCVHGALRGLDWPQMALSRCQTRHASAFLEHRGDCISQMWDTVRVLFCLTLEEWVFISFVRSEPNAFSVPLHHVSCTSALTSSLHSFKCLFVCLWFIHDKYAIDRYSITNIVVINHILSLLDLTEKERKIMLKPCCFSIKNNQGFYS